MNEEEFQKFILRRMTPTYRLVPTPITKEELQALRLANLRQLSPGEQLIRILISISHESLNSLYWMLTRPGKFFSFVFATELYKLRD